MKERLLTVRLFLSSALVVLLVYLVLKLVQTKCDRKRIERDEKGGGKPRKLLKGVVRQRVDVFVSKVVESLPHVTEADARRIFPRKYETHGHVVVVRLNKGTTVDELRPLGKFFAETFVVPCDVVLLDVDGIIGELRRPKLEILYMAEKSIESHAAITSRTVKRRWEESRSKKITSYLSLSELDVLVTKCTGSPTYTVHVENGVMYGFDVQKVMFCSGNTTERMHFGTIDAKGETVVDMFCGIGYFTLPLAIHGGVAVLHALEKNPDSVEYLKVNTVLNKVDHLVQSHCGDNRVVGDELVGKCDRVLMGYIPSCKTFLPRAVSFLKKNDAGHPCGIVHYHLLADKSAAGAAVMSDLKAELGEDVTTLAHVKSLRCVKSYAPKRYHFVADILFS